MMICHTNVGYIRGYCTTHVFFYHIPYCIIFENKIGPTKRKESGTRCDVVSRARFVAANNRASRVAVSKALSGLHMCNT